MVDPNFKTVNGVAYNTAHESFKTEDAFLKEHAHHGTPDELKKVYKELTKPATDKDKKAEAPVKKKQQRRPIANN